MKPRLVESISENKCLNEIEPTLELVLHEEKTAKLDGVRVIARTIAHNIRQRRLELGLSQFDVAARANISQKYLSKLESSRVDGCVCPSAAVFLRLCDALESSPDDMRHAHGRPESKRHRISRNSVRRELSQLALQLPQGHASVVKQLVDMLLEIEGVEDSSKDESGL